MDLKPLKIITKSVIQHVVLVYRTTSFNCDTEDSDIGQGRN